MSTNSTFGGTVKEALESEGPRSWAKVETLTSIANIVITESEVLRFMLTRFHRKSIIVERSA
jgi:hypothetical protein